MTIAREIEGLRQMSVPELVERYEAAFGGAPRVKNREWLWKRIAWRIQEQRFGGLSTVAKQRLEAMIAEIDLPAADRQRTVSGKLRAPRQPSVPPIGTVLVREWRGQELRLTVVDDGFELNGTVYKSLSASARAATGARWNGRLFWGLVNRRQQP